MTASSEGLTPREPNTEREIKLAFSVELQARLNRMAGEAGKEGVGASIVHALGFGDYEVRPRPTLALRDEYFDSADLVLAQLQCSLRVRYGEGQPVATLKVGLTRMPGLLARREINAARGDDQVQALVREGFAHLILAELPGVPLPLRRVLTIHNQREELDVTNGMEQYRIAIDSYTPTKPGEVPSRNATPVLEIEIEAGTDAAARQLPALRDRLKNLIGDLDLAIVSKYENGIRILQIGLPTVPFLLRRTFSNEPVGILSLVVSIASLVATLLLARK